MKTDKNTVKTNSQFSSWMNNIREELCKHETAIVTVIDSPTKKKRYIGSNKSLSGR